MLNLNTESLKRPFIPQGEPPQAQKKLKISGKNEHAETIDMLADVIYKLGTSLSLFCDSGVKDFVYTILSRNTISESDEQIKELYASVTGDKSSEGNYNIYSELAIKGKADKVDEISKELTPKNLLKIIELFSEYLNNFFTHTPTSFQQLIDESTKISKATLSGQDTGPLREKLCKAFYVVVRKHCQESITNHREDFPRLEMLGEKWGMDPQNMLDDLYDSLKEYQSFYWKYLPKKVLNQLDVILELASMCSFQLDILNMKARGTLATSSD
jgi:hypothetical protein